MKFKHILAIIAFFATFIFSVLLIGVPVKKTSCFTRNFSSAAHTHNRTTQRKITNLLKRDIANGDFRDLNIRASSDFYSDDTFGIPSNYVDEVEDYVSQSEQLNDADLPYNFQNAWREHMRAWREHADFLETSQTSCLMRSLDSDDIRRVYLSQNAEITKTWHKVLRVAKSHGAAIPANALPNFQGSEAFMP